MRLRASLLYVLALSLVLLLQYILVTNGTVTGAFSSSDTGRLSPWPTLITIPPYRYHTLNKFGPLIGPFVYPAYVLCRITFRYAELHPDGLLMSYFVTAARTPHDEHLFLIQLALFNSAVWVLAWAAVRRAWHKLRPQPRAA